MTVPVVLVARGGVASTGQYTKGVVLFPPCHCLEEVDENLTSVCVKLQQRHRPYVWRRLSEKLQYNRVNYHYTCCALQLPQACHLKVRLVCWTMNAHCTCATEAANTQYSTDNSKNKIARHNASYAPLIWTGLQRCFFFLDGSSLPWSPGPEFPALTSHGVM